MERCSSSRSPYSATSSTASTPHSVSASRSATGPVRPSLPSNVARIRWALGATMPPSSPASTCCSSSAVWSRSRRLGCSRSRCRAFFSIQSWLWEVFGDERPDSIGEEGGPSAGVQGAEALKTPEIVARGVVAMLNADGGEVWVGLREENERAVVVESIQDREREARRLLDYLVAPSSLLRREEGPDGPGRERGRYRSPGHHPAASGAKALCLVETRRAPLRHPVGPRVRTGSRGRRSSRGSRLATPPRDRGSKMQRRGFWQSGSSDRKGEENSSGWAWSRQPTGPGPSGSGAQSSLRRAQPDPQLHDGV